jgi:hypothetical protein
VVVVFLSPTVSAAQSFMWSVAPSVVVDSEFSGGTELGPAVSLEASVPAGRPMSYVLLLTLARTDFLVASDELHRNFASAALGIRLMTRGEGLTFGVTLGAGLLVSDDVNETDPDFRSSARGEELLVPGVEARFEVGESWGFTAFARDQVTGWFNAVFDPEEGELSHRFLFGAGVYFR